MKRKQNSALRFTQIGPVSNVFFNLLMILLCLACLVPLLLVLAISVSAEESINQSGYRLLPGAFSFEGYAYLFKQQQTILRAL